MADVNPLKLVDLGSGQGQLREMQAGDKIPGDLLPATEWTAETVSRAEAEAGAGTTRRAWTAQRVRQAIVAWWNGATSAFGRGFVGAADAAAGRAALWLGTAATANVQTSSTDTTAGALMAVGAFGLGGADLTWLVDLDNRLIRPGFYGCADTTGDPSPYGVVHIVGKASGEPTRTWVHQVFYDTLGNVYDRYSTNLAPWSPLRLMYHSGNTTVDANGFIKLASPIIRLYSDTRGSEFVRVSTGVYELTGCNGLRLSDGWYIETPHDRNKVPYFNVEWYQDIEPNADAGVLEEPADVTLRIECYERVWNPQTGQYDNGEPVDIPEGRWIDLRMDEVRPEVEIEV